MKYTAIFAALLLTGCATQQTVTRDLNVQIAAVEKARAEAEKARYDAIAMVAANGNEAAKVAAVVALALGANKGSVDTPKFVAPEQPKSALDTLFHVALGVADRALQVYGIRSNANVAIKQSEYNRDIFTTSYQTIADVASRIQAPQANITNTTTNTTNVTNSNNTTRTCVGGQGAQGGTATGTTGGSVGGSGAPGGAASC